MTVRVRDGRITWSDYDVTAFSAMIGPDLAVQRHAPYLPSLLKLAKKHKRVQLAKSARVALKKEIALRKVAERLKDKLDATPHNKRERKAFGHQRSFGRFARKTKQKRLLIADQVGVGKTGSAILFLHSVNARNILVVTKNTAKDQWKDAYRFFLGRDAPPITIVDGTIPEQIALAQRSHGVVIAHWESLAHAQVGYLKRTWDAVIADEAHLAGNHDTKRSNTLHRLKTEYHLAATANPFTNHPGELFGILQALHPQRYTSYWRFANMHCEMTPKAFGGFEYEGAKRPALLEWELAPFTVQRTKKQVYKNLPAIAHTRRTLRLSKRGMTELEKLKKQLFAELKAIGGGDTVIPIINDLSRLTRVRQYLVDPGLIGARERSVKYEAVLEDVQSFTDPYVIFSEWKETVLRLGAFLTKNKFHVGYIHGGMQKDGRATKAKKQFLAGRYDVLLVVASAGDTALNLGKFGLVGHLDLPWHPRGWEQRNGRVDRPEENTGKLVPTTSYRYIIKDSYEERLEQRLLRKHSAFRDVFTVADLEELFDA